MNINSASLYTAAMAVFVVTNLFVYIEAAADPSNSSPEITSISPDSEKKLLESSTIVETSPKSIFRGPIFSILTPDLLTHPDPLAYLLPRVTKMGYNGGIREFGLTTMRLQGSLNIVDNFLKARRFHKSYIPYAKLLSSLVSCLIKLHKVATQIREIQLKHSKESDYPAPPTENSIPEVRSLLSRNVFSDSNIPLVLLQEILKIPADKIADVKKNLNKLLDNLNLVEQPYYIYVHFLLIFLQKSEDEIYRLRYENAAILKRISSLNTLPSAAVESA